MDEQQANTQSLNTPFPTTSPTYASSINERESSSIGSPFVFLSYAHANSDLAKRLQADLLIYNIAIWVDQESIQPGTSDWEEELRSAIRNASAVVLVASPEARTSRYVKDELRIAEMYQRPVYPLWVAGDHWMDVAPIGWGAYNI